MKRKLRWNLQHQEQNSFQERPVMAFNLNYSSKQ